MKFDLFIIDKYLEMISGSLMGGLFCGVCFYFQAKSRVKYYVKELKTTQCPDIIKPYHDNYAKQAALMPWIVSYGLLLLAIVFSIRARKLVMEFSEVPLLNFVLKSMLIGVGTLGFTLCVAGCFKLYSFSSKQFYNARATRREDLKLQAEEERKAQRDQLESDAVLCVLQAKLTQAQQCLQLTKEASGKPELLVKTADYNSRGEEYR